MVTTTHPTSEGERVIDALLHGAHVTPPHELPAPLAHHVGSLGVTDVVAYPADLQQDVLVPFQNDGLLGLRLRGCQLSDDAILLLSEWRSGNESDLLY